MNHKLPKLTAEFIFISNESITGSFTNESPIDSALCEIHRRHSLHVESLLSQRHSSFMNGVYPPSNTPTHSPFSAASNRVPSRLYTSLLPPEQFPLAGLRYCLKDIFDLEVIRIPRIHPHISPSQCDRAAFNVSSMPAPLSLERQSRDNSIWRVTAGS